LFGIHAGRWRATGSGACVRAEGVERACDLEERGVLCEGMSLRVFDEEWYRGECRGHVSGTHSTGGAAPGVQRHGTQRWETWTGERARGAGGKGG
jgi:hypothetical protein